jgi:hypothetical protein
MIPFARPKDAGECGKYPKAPLLSSYHHRLLASVANAQSTRCGNDSRI